MDVLVGDAEFWNEVESLELFTSSREAQDLLYGLGWMPEEHTLDPSVLIQYLQLLLNYADAKGWEELLNALILGAARRDVLHNLVGAFDISSLDWRNILTESTGHPAAYTLPSLCCARVEPESSHTIVSSKRGTRGSRPRYPWVGSSLRLAVSSATVACVVLQHPEQVTSVNIVAALPLE